MVYLIHFETPFKHARHYVGFAHEGNLEKRIEHHRNGTGSRLMRAVTLAGIPWTVVRTWPDGDQYFERRLKNQCSSDTFCPVCNPKRALNNMKG